MRTQDIALLLIIGFLIWIAGTVYFAYAGPTMLETTRARYWINFVILPVISSVLCAGILRWRQIPPANWTSAMLLLAIPGLIGEALVLARFSTFMPKLQGASAGKYGALLFASYAVVLAVAEAFSLKAH